MKITYKDITLSEKTFSLTATIKTPRYNNIGKTMNFIQNQHYSVSIAINDKFIYLNTRSGYGILTMVPNYPSVLLPTGSPNDVLGEKLIQALANSNTQFNNKQYEQLFNPKSLKEEWKIWLEMLKTNMAIVLSTNC